jgi:thiamine kinase
MDIVSITQEVLGRNAVLSEPPHQLRGGLASEVWRVVTSHRSIVIRIGPPHKADSHVNHASENAILRVAAAARIGPAVLLADPKRHLVVTELIAGKPWGPRAIRKPANMTRLVTLLRHLHQLEVPKEALVVEPQQVIAGYWNALMERGMAARAGSSKVRGRIKALADQFAQDGKRCLCHNDIHHRNIIDTTLGTASSIDSTPVELRLVDWEHAGIGDPLFDLAGVCCHHSFNDATRTQLLREYLGNDSSSALKRLHQACTLFNYIRELWFAVREM